MVDCLAITVAVIACSGIFEIGSDFSSVDDVGPDHSLFRFESSILYYILRFGFARRYRA